MDPDINVKSKTVKLLEKIIGENLYHLDLGKDFLALTSKVQHMKEKIDNWTSLMSESFAI